MLVSVLTLLFTQQVAAFTQNDFDCVGNNTCFYDPSAQCSATGSSAAADPTTTGGSVYILGDSITVRAEGDGTYQQALQQKGFSSVSIDGSSSRSLSAAGTDGNMLNGMDAIAKDKDDISSASAIVVALGTNGLGPTSSNDSQSINAAIQALKADNSTAPIYWVDTFVLDRPSYNQSVITPANKAIYGEASSQNYQVVSWAKTVDPSIDPQNPSGNESDPNNYIDNSDGLGVHPTQSGATALANLVANAIGSPSNPASSSPTGCCASSSTVQTPPANTPAPSTGSLSIPADFTLSDKIGQLLTVGVTDQTTATDLEKKYQIGGFLLNSGFSYDAATISSVKQAGELPPLFAVDEESKEVDRLNIGLPTAEAMGTMSTDQVKQLGETVGKKMASLGINVDFAPVLDVNDGKNAAISTSDRSFGTSSDSLATQVQTIATKAGAFADGLRDNNVTPTFKHFPGLGRATGPTNGNTDTGPATTPDLNSLEANDLKPYEQLLKSKSTNAVMVGNQTVPDLTDGQPASLSKASYDLLSSRYSFDQVTFTDALNASAITGGIPNAVVEALEAGASMPLFNVTSEAQVDPVVNAVQQAVNSGQLSESVIDNDLSKIINLKNSSAGSSTSTASPVSASPDSSGACCSDSTTSFGPGTLPSYVPAPYNAIFTAASKKPNVDPAVLVGIFYDEQYGYNSAVSTFNKHIWPDPPPPYGHGPPWSENFISNGSGTWPDGTVGARGPFQFEPGTYKAYMIDGNGNGKPDPTDLTDESFSAAAYLGSLGATIPETEAKVEKAASSYSGGYPIYSQAAWTIVQTIKTDEASGNGAAATPTATTSSSDTTSGCGQTAASGSISPGCAVVTGNAQILCEAKQYQGIYYSLGGGHQPYASFRQQCPESTLSGAEATSTAASPGPCATDCSGLVSVAVDAVFGQTTSWDVAGIETDTKNWQPINIKDVQPGDVVTQGADTHVEIVDHYDASSNQLHTFGSHAPGVQTGPVTTSPSIWTGAYRYIEPGSSN
jgi:beta-N-acetylhexosaminidase